ncbi:hypothetical protein [Brevibacillus laterosporus]|uniref:hypothetical protein n=1 Tax=Brevibacillus laterosporus TaxID=1465 RepID=UPI0015E23681|nr:hypothetical protein [Brevibacillus laterosporus]MED1664641.1 hypothetical protein [Brevibacillus laterosporus]MED1670076.1 hypothetical protein [Brevibacillus laterosporus]MED1718975.1 hypothetical protein [Brevibacillus laterosporus]
MIQRDEMFWIIQFVLLTQLMQKILATNNHYCFTGLIVVDYLNDCRREKFLSQG